MTTEKNWAHPSVSPAQIDAVVRRARTERAEVMRAALAELPAILKRAAASFTSARQGVPHKGTLGLNVGPTGA